MKKIFILETGGTIACEVNDKGQLEVGKTSVLDLIKVKDKNMFNVVNIDGFLSENITFENLTSIYNNIKSIDLNECSGIIITHGSDTLDFTAQFLYATLNNYLVKNNIPLVLVCAKLPLFDDETNGYDNFFGAVKFIEEGKKAGVFVCYKNDNDSLKIHGGDNILQSRVFTNDFHSYKNNFIAELVGSSFVFNKDYFKLNNPFKKSDAIKKHSVLVLQSYALMDFKTLENVANKYDYIIISSYHSGTICTNDNADSILSIADKCKKILLVGGSSSNNTYSSFEKLSKSNIEIINNLPLENVYANCILGNV